MHNLLNTINWEHVLYAIFTILTACGVSFGWLKTLCKKIESTSLRVEEHRDEIREIMGEMRSIIDEYKEMTGK